MKYYLIFKHTGEPDTKFNYPTYIVEHEYVAKAFCKEYNEFYYEERDDGNQYLITPSIGTITYNEDDGLTLLTPEGFAAVERRLEEEAHDVNPLSRGLNYDVKCPYCGARHFMIGGGMSTCMYCPTIMKDGKVISKHHNIYTEEYECLECHKRFKSVNGKIMKNEER